jgi:hypothetical protein
MSGEPFNPRLYPEVFNGMRVVVSEHCLKDVPNDIKPSRHRSKRVLKKLMKRTHREPAIFSINGTLMMHPDTYLEFKRKLKENDNFVR